MCIDPAIEADLKQHGYVIKEAIGKGGFAECYKVYSQKYKQDFAVKVITLKEEKKELMTRSFKSEYDALTTLSHPNVVQVYDSLYSQNHIYLILEYCSKGDLQSYIKKNGPLNKTTLYQYIYSIVDALAYLESKNFSHNDIKPSNILIDSYGRPKLADFGLSKKVDHNSLSEDYTGTLLFLAPEILNRKSYNPLKADIWSFGIMLYYLTTNTFPFEEQTFKGLQTLAQTGYFYIPSNIDPIYKKLLNMSIVVKPENRGTFFEMKELMNQYRDVSQSLPKLSAIRKHMSTTTTTIITVKSLHLKRISRTPKPVTTVTFSGTYC